MNFDSVWAVREVFRSIWKAMEQNDYRVNFTLKMGDSAIDHTVFISSILRTIEHYQNFQSLPWVLLVALKTPIFKKKTAESEKKLRFTRSVNYQYPVEVSRP